MINYRLEMELLSEAIFASGHSVPGSVDLEIIYDDLGLPYLKGKTLKGNLREEAEKIVDFLGEDYDYCIASLFGEEKGGLDSWRTLKFSDCRIDPAIENLLRKKVEEGKLSPMEIKESLTDVRTFTSIDRETGSTKEGSLRSARVIRKGLILVADLDLTRELDRKEKAVLASSVLMMRNIASMRTRGKGRVDCRLILDGKDITDEYVAYLKEEVI